MIVNNVLPDGSLSLFVVAVGSIEEEEAVVTIGFADDDEIRFVD